MSNRTDPPPAFRPGMAVLVIDPFARGWGIHSGTVVGVRTLREHLDLVRAGPPHNYVPAAAMARAAADLREELADQLDHTCVVVRVVCPAFPAGAEFAFHAWQLAPADAGGGPPSN